jgi:hypothetical protein
MVVSSELFLIMCLLYRLVVKTALIYVWTIYVLVVTYFPTYLPVSETYFFENWLPTWNQRLTQLRFIHNWVMVGIQWMVQWSVLVHCGPWIVGTWLTNHCGKLWDRNTWESISCSHTIHPACCPGLCWVAGELRWWRYNRTWIHSYVLTSILCT